MSPTTYPTPTGGVMCEDLSPRERMPEPAFAMTFPRLFPPVDADADTRRAWLAASPWPEVVFSSAC